MLTVSYRDSRTFAFRFNGPHFTRYKHVAGTKLSTREWKPRERVWIAPLECLDELRVLVDEHLCGQGVIAVDAKAQVAYDRHMAWRESMVQAQGQGLDRSQKAPQNGAEPPKLLVPATFKGELPPYQSAAVEWLHGAFSASREGGAILGDVVGLGKTVEAIAFAESLREQGELATVLVVCPASLKKKWEAEIHKFTDHPVTVLQAKSKVGAKAWAEQWSAGHPYTIVNYDLLWRYPDEFAGMKPGLLVLDEIQYAKSLKAKRTKAAIKLAKRVPRVVGLSATFLENTLEDLFSVFQIIDPGAFLDNFALFDSRFIVRDFFGGVKGYKNLEIVTERIGPYVLRRRKEEVAEQLKGRIAGNIIETDRWIELAPEQRQLYDQVKDQLAGLLEDMQKAKKIIMAEVLPLLTYLRQACLSPVLIGAKESHRGSTKLTELYRILGGFEPDEKFVVFCFFTDMCDMIAHELNRRGYGALSVHGKNSKPDERNELCRQFNEGTLMTGKRPCRVIVASDALREGQDMQGASTLINFDLLWNPQAMRQRTGRIDRVGQKSPILNVINIIAEDTVEARMKAVLEDKQDLFDIVVEGGWRSDRLTVQKIRALIS